MRQAEDASTYSLQARADESSLLSYMPFNSFSDFLRAIHTVTRTGSVFARHTFTNSLGRAPYHLPHRPKAYQSLLGFPFFGALFGSSSSMTKSYPITKTESQWKLELTPEQFRILRQKGTEPKGTDPSIEKLPETGVYHCAGCGHPLYKANHKFPSHCGWPAFWDAIPGAVGRNSDTSFGMMRTEIVCNNCGGHLGHVFKGEGYDNPTDERHCVNSISLNFNDGEEKQDQAMGQGKEEQGQANDEGGKL